MCSTQVLKQFRHIPMFHLRMSFTFMFNFYGNENVCELWNLFCQTKYRQATLAYVILPIIFNDRLSVTMVTGTKEL